MTQPAARVGSGFIDPLLAAAVKSHTGATGEDKPPYAVGPAAVKHVACPQHVNPMKPLPGAPDSRDPTNVLHNVDSLTGGGNRLRVSQVPLDLLHTKLIQECIPGPGK